MAKDTKKEEKTENDSVKFDEQLIERFTILIKGFSDFSEIKTNNDKYLLPHFADEKCICSRIAFEFSDYRQSISSNQLRKFYTDIKDIEYSQDWEKAEIKLNLLKPKLALSAFRKSNGQPLIHIKFYQLIRNAMDKIKVENNEELSFKNLKLFSRFFEAIIGYHKFYNGKKKFEDDTHKSDKDNDDKKPDDFDRNWEDKEYYIAIKNEGDIDDDKFNFSVIGPIIDEISSFESLKELKTLNKPSFEDVGGYADKIAYEFPKKDKNITSNQIRRFYNELKLIEKIGNWYDAKDDFYLLNPRMAYSVSRDSETSKNLIPLEFYTLIKTTMNCVYIEDDAELSFDNLKLFVKFFEAIVAFHKFYSL